MGKYWRTNFWYKTVRFFTKGIFTRKFNFHSEKVDIKAPFIVLCNHTTDYDAILIASAFKEPIHFVMSDHVSSIPVAGKLIKHLVAPIPITKSTLDVATVKKMFTVAKNGGALGLFPEGNKSFSGEMSDIKPSIAKLLKRLNIPVVIYTIYGGYLTSPRWTKNKRKGSMHGAVKKIIDIDELASLSEEELYNVVVSNLRVSAYEVQAHRKTEFIGEDLAKNIESLLYVCPICGKIGTVYGEHNYIKCTNCDLLGEYDNYGYIIGTPFSRLDKWDEWQKEQILKTDFSNFGDNPIVEDNNFSIKKKINNYKNKKMGTYKISLFKNKLSFVPEETNKEEDAKSFDIALDQIAGYGVEGVNGIQLWTKSNDVFRINNDYSVSGLKYVNLICALNGNKMKF